MASAYHPPPPRAHRGCARTARAWTGARLRSGTAGTAAAHRAPMRITRCLVFAVILGASASATANPIGVEWEFNGRDVAVAGFDAGNTAVDPAEIVRTLDGRRPNKKLICTTEVREGDFFPEMPVVAVTYDLGGSTRILELVTAPLELDDAQDRDATAATTAVTQFVNALEQTCNSTYPCSADLGAVLTRLNTANPSSWQRCGGVYQLANTRVSIEVKTAPATWNYGYNTQVNIQLDLPRLIRPDRSLYTQQVNATTHDVFRGKDKVNSMRKQLINVLSSHADWGNYPANLKGFLVAYYLSLNVVHGRPFKVSHWKIKNYFDVMLKAPLDEVATLIHRDANFRKTYWAVSNVVYQLDFDLGKKLCVNGECQYFAIEQSNWADALHRGHDPLELRTHDITNPIEPGLHQGGDIIVVAESRLTENPLNQHLTLAHDGNTPGAVSFVNLAAAKQLLAAYFAP